MAQSFVHFVVVEQSFVHPSEFLIVGCDNCLEFGSAYAVLGGNMFAVVRSYQALQALRCVMAATMAGVIQQQHEPVMKHLTCSIISAFVNAVYFECPDTNPTLARERARESARTSVYVGMCVRVCVCVCVYVCVCMWVCVCECVRACVWVKTEREPESKKEREIDCVCERESIGESGSE